MFEQNSLITITQDMRELLHEIDSALLKEESFVYLGLIPNMPGHCVVAGFSGKVYYGLHPELFRVLTEDEV